MLMLVAIFIASLLIGSLLNIIIIRLPREKRLLGLPPRCTRTGEPLALWQVLPVVGWVAQGGKARNGKPLDSIYLLVEIITAIAFTLLYYQYGFSVLFFYLCFACVVLIVTGAIDWTHRYIYTFVILGATLLSFILSAVGVIPDMNLLNTGIGLFVAGVVFILFFILGKVLFPSHAVPFGMGDVYLALFLGATFGFTRLINVLWYGILLAGVAAVFIIVARKVQPQKKTIYMSYGTYLCLGAIIYMLVKPW